MKLTFTSTAAILALTGTTALAQMGSYDHGKMHSAMSMDAMSTEELAQNEGNLIRSRDITGGAIYTMNAADDEGWNVDMTYEGVNADWTQIGEIEDLVLNADGKITGIVAEVGGFLDIGDKHVVMSVQDLNLVPVDDRSFVYLTRYSEEQLEEMTGVNEGFWN
jgi:hypothetical protein